MQLIGYDEPAAQPFAPGDEVKTYLEKLEQELGVKIEVIWSSATTKVRDDKIDDTNVFKIFDLATPGEKTQLNSPDHIYYSELNADGKPVDPNKSYFLPFKQRSKIRYKFDNMAVAYSYMDVAGGSKQLLGNFDYGTFWSYIPMVNFSKVPEDGRGHDTQGMLEMIFGHWLRKAADKGFATKEQERRMAVVRDKFMARAKMQTEQRLNSIKLKMTQQEQTMASLHQQMLAADVALKQHGREASYLQETKDKDDEMIVGQLDELMRNARFEKIDYNVDNYALQIYTKDLWLYSPDQSERVPLGKFRIDYYLDGQQIKIYNLTNTRGGRQHPHVPETAEPCWGGFETSIRKWLMDSEFVALFEGTMEFLESYYPEDYWGKWADYWWRPQQELIEFRQEDGSYLTAEAIAAKTKVEVKEEKPKAKKKTAKKVTQPAEATTAETLQQELVV